VCSSDLVSLIGSPPGFPSEGYALVENEVIGYTRAIKNLAGVYSLEMPVDRRGEGILHGCYGSGATGHGNEAIAVAIPFRYWDRYLPESDRSELAYLQGSFTMAARNSVAVSG
jgi:hypothetical protein